MVIGYQGIFDAAYQGIFDATCQGIFDARVIVSPSTTKLP